MNIKLYTTHCPKCKALTMKLNQKGIKYIEVEDVDEMIKLGIKSAPVLSVDGTLLDFMEAIKFANEYSGQ